MAKKEKLSSSLAYTYRVKKYIRNKRTNPAAKNHIRRCEWFLQFTDQNRSRNIKSVHELSKKDFINFYITSGLGIQTLKDYYTSFKIFKKLFGLSFDIPDYKLFCEQQSKD